MPVNGAELDDNLRLRIAGMAVVPVLELGLDWYDRWQTLILYEGPFVAEHSWEDEFGIVHAETSERSGEAWERGPVVLSLEDVRHSGQGDGYNVVIHELAHTLDMRDASANGAPPLHAGMDPAAWQRDFAAAWNDLARRADNDEPLPVDEYALEDPAEFFAVLSETFFEQPEPLHAAWPAVYRHLAAFYRQEPLTSENAPTCASHPSRRWRPAWMKRFQSKGTWRRVIPAPLPVLGVVMGYAVAHVHFAGECHAPPRYRRRHPDEL